MVTDELKELELMKVEMIGSCILNSKMAGPDQSMAVLK